MKSATRDSPIPDAKIWNTSLVALCLTYRLLLSTMQKPLLFSTLSQLEFERAVLGRVVAGVPLHEGLEQRVHRVGNRPQLPFPASALVGEDPRKSLVHRAAPGLS